MYTYLNFFNQQSNVNALVEKWRKCYKVKEGDLQSTDNNLASTHDGVVPNKIVAVTIPFEAPNLSDVNTKKRCPESRAGDRQQSTQCTFYWNVYTVILHSHGTHLALLLNKF